VFPVSIWGFGALFGGAKHTKDPMATGLGSHVHLFKLRCWVV